MTFQGPGLGLECLLTEGKLPQGQSRKQIRTSPVPGPKEIRGEGRPCSARDLFRGDAARRVVGVKVSAPRGEQVRVLRSECAEPLNQFRQLAHHVAIGEPKSKYITRRHTQVFESSRLFGRAKYAEAGVRVIGICTFPIRHRYDRYLDLRRTERSDQTAHSEDFIVRVGNNDEKWKDGGRTPLRQLVEERRPAIFRYKWNDHSFTFAHSTCADRPYQHGKLLDVSSLKMRLKKIKLLFRVDDELIEEVRRRFVADVVYLLGGFA